MPTDADHLVDWGLQSIAVTTALVAVGGAYLRGWWALSKTSAGRVSTRRLVAFASGLGLFWIAWSTRLSLLTHALLTAHMAQHLLFVLAAAPLVLIGSPVLVFSNAFGQSASGKESSKELGSTWARTVGRWLTHPVVAGSSMVIVTVGWHVPWVFALAMGSPAWHAAENLTFFASGLLFWWPVILPWPSRPQWPRWTVPLYLLGSDMPVSVLSAYLAFCGHVVYPAYLHAPRAFALSPLQDQVAAAMLMWLAMLVVFLAVAAVIVVGLLEPSAGRA